MSVRISAVEKHSAEIRIMLLLPGLGDLDSFCPTCRKQRDADLQQV